MTIGIVIIEIKLTSATVFEATPVSLSYFEANINVLFAQGTLAVIALATSSVPVIPHSLYIPRQINGIKISFKNATR